MLQADPVVDGATTAHKELAKVMQVLVSQRVCSAGPPDTQQCSRADWHFCLPNWTANDAAPLYAQGCQRGMCGLAQAVLCSLRLVHTARVEHTISHTHSGFAKWYCHTLSLTAQNALGI